MRGRDEVRSFGGWMIAKLNRGENARKGSWLKRSRSYLFARLVQESFELAWALIVLAWREKRFTKRVTTHDMMLVHQARLDVINEAADVANFAMMLADKTGAMNSEK